MFFIRFKLFIVYFCTGLQRQVRLFWFLVSSFELDYLVILTPLPSARIAGVSFFSLVRFHATLTMHYHINSAY